MFENGLTKGTHTFTIIIIIIAIKSGRIMTWHYLHIFNRINSDTSHTDITDYTWVVTVVSK